MCLVLQVCVVRGAAITGLESIKEGKDVGWLCTSEPLEKYKTLYLSTTEDSDDEAEEDLSFIYEAILVWGFSLYRRRLSAWECLLRLQHMD